MTDDGKPRDERPSEDPDGVPDDKPEDDDDSREEVHGPITFDRFKSHRKGSAVSWPHVILLVLMLATLLVLVTFKDHCGRAVSGFLFMTTQDRGVAPNVRIQLEPAPGTGSGSSKQ